MGDKIDFRVPSPEIPLNKMDNNDRKVAENNTLKVENVYEQLGKY